MSELILPFEELRCPECGSNYYALNSSSLTIQSFNYTIPDAYRQIFEFFLLCQATQESLSILPNEILWLILELTVKYQDQLQVYCQCRSLDLVDLYIVYQLMHFIQTLPCADNEWIALLDPSRLSVRTRQLIGCAERTDISETDQINLGWTKNNTCSLLYVNIPDDQSIPIRMEPLPNLSEIQLYTIFIHMKLRQETIYNYDDDGEQGNLFRWVGKVRINKKSQDSYYSWLKDNFNIHI